MRITYLFDPLCGWCYGAGPAIERLGRLDDATLELAPVGLFAGDGARPMNARFAAFAWDNDQRVARLSGQPFTQMYRDRVLGTLGGTFDSAPATLGLVAVGLTEPSRELAALRVLQHARYVDGRDNTSHEAVADILDNAGFTAAARHVRTPDPALLATYRRRIEAARADMAQFGVHGVPALVVDDDVRRRILPGSALFGRFDLLTAQLKAA